MKKLLLLSLFTLFLISCGSTKNTAKVPETVIGKNEPSTKSIRKTNQPKNNKTIGLKTEKNEEEIESIEEKILDTRKYIINFAKTFQGTRYKFGGTTDSGMDCSGLVYTAFQQKNISLPRISRDMATKGISISLNDIEAGDLVFFKTSSRNTINHVGLVVESNHGEIKFIHSTIRAGVIISSLEESYWKKAFVEVRRVI
jgi:cell wall-associated NlpC family hydrolase